MHFHLYLIYAVTLLPHVSPLEKPLRARIAVTPHILPLTAHPHHALPPSTHHLHTRRSLARRQLLDLTTPAPSNPSPNTTSPSLAPIQHPLLTLAGRIYLTTITLSSHPYTVVIDTGSSDTWVAAKGFECTSRWRGRKLPQGRCGFGELYDEKGSTGFEKLEGDFRVAYESGEWLGGGMAGEDLGLGEGVKGTSNLTVRQTIGVVERGWWMGDGMSSGLMGLAYASMASNQRRLGYESVMFSFFKAHALPPLFSLALTPPTPSSPHGGGLLAIGGIPDVPHDGNWVSVPITPLVSSTYTFYRINIDGFVVEPPYYISSSSSSSSLSSPSSPTPLTNLTSSIPTILDSGTSLIYLPDALTAHIASLFQPPGIYHPDMDTWEVECGARPPRLGVVIKEITFWVEDEDMIGGEEGVGCVSGVQEMGRGDAVLGDAWLRRVVVVFDVGEGVVRVVKREGGEGRRERGK